MLVYRRVARPTDNFEAMMAIYSACEHGPHRVWTRGKTVPHTFPAPNQGLQPTPYSLRSCVAPTSRRGWHLALAPQTEEVYMAEPSITHLERRKIEAGVVIPMVQAFQRAKRNRARSNL